MLKCAICGKEFKDTQLDEYAAHVQKCAAEESLKRKTKDMEKINQELDEVKRAKVIFEGLRDSFKKKYPDIYKANFNEETNKCTGNCKNNSREDKPNESPVSSGKAPLKKPINKGFSESEKYHKKEFDEDNEDNKYNEMYLNDFLKFIDYIFDLKYN